jgi:hypothetical protein
MWLDQRGHTRDAQLLDQAWRCYGNRGGSQSHLERVQLRQAAGDCQLHLEWVAPTRIKGEGQERGNSGVLLMGVYELQVLDGYQNPTYADGVAAAIYGQYPPLVNACRQPGEWLCYDIIWMTPRFEGEQVGGLCHDPAQWHCGAQPRRLLGAHPASAGSRVSPAPADRPTPTAGSS